MTRRERATTAGVIGAVFWLGGWFTLGATVGIDFGDGYMHYGLAGGCALMGMSLLPFVAAAFFLGVIIGLSRWIDAGKE